MQEVCLKSVSTLGIVTPYPNFGFNLSPYVWISWNLDPHANQEQELGPQFLFYPISVYMGFNSLARTSQEHFSVACWGFPCFL